MTQHLRPKAETVSTFFTVALAHRGVKGIWQRRIWDHHIRDPQESTAHVRCCWGNPAKHGLVKQAADWPDARVHRDVRLGQVQTKWSRNVDDSGQGGGWVVLPQDRFTHHISGMVGEPVPMARNYPPAISG